MSEKDALDARIGLTPPHPKWSPDFTQEELEHLSPNEQLSTAVFQALGSASVAWSMIEAAGEFQTDFARAVGDGLLEWIRSHGEWSTQ